MSLKLHKKTYTLHPIQLKLLKVLTASFLNPVLPPPYHHAVFVGLTRFYDARLPNSTHTYTYILLCRWLGTKLLAQHPRLFLWDTLRHISSGSVLLQFPETQNVTYSAVSSGLYGFQPLLLLDVIW